MPGLFQKVIAWFLKKDTTAPKHSIRPKIAENKPLYPPAAARTSPQPAPPPSPVHPATPPPEPLVQRTGAEPPAASAPPPPAQTASSPAPARPGPAIATPQPEAIVDLHIGLDLGTSCSKIAIGDAFLDHCHGVHFDPAARSVQKYLFPTRFFEDQSRASLTPIPGATSRGDLKLRLMDAVEKHADTSEPETDLAIYLALLLQHAFDWFAQHAAVNHRNRPLCWWLNVGFPAKRIEGNSRLFASYTRACTAAARAVDAGEPISRSSVQRCFDPQHTKNHAPRIPSDRIHLYPEIAAQLAGYAYSPYRKDGPLLLLDIGAGTLDVSTLILHRRDGEQVCSFHFCEVVQLGAFRLYQETHAAMRRIDPTVLLPPLSASDDPAWLPPASARDLLLPRASLSSSLQQAFFETRSAFGERCLDTCQINFARFKTYLNEPFVTHNRRPPAFRERVNFILSGGGSRAQFYSSLYPEQLEERLLSLTSWHRERYERQKDEQGLHRIYFTQPEKFRATAIGATDFDRLSVAHGLSMGVETLMRITAKEASDRQWGTT
jgi:hypothetical protein